MPFPSDGRRPHRTPRPGRETALSLSSAPMTALLVVIAIFIALVLWSKTLQELLGLLMLIGLLQFFFGS